MRHSFAYLLVAVGFLAIGAFAALGLRKRRRQTASRCVWCGAHQGETHAKYCHTEGREC